MSRYSTLIASGRCVRCGKPNPNGNSRCDACRVKARQRDRERAERLKRARLCIDCRAGLLPEWPHVRCMECHDRNRDSTNAYNTSPRGRAKHRRRMASLYAARRLAETETGADRGSLAIGQGALFGGAA